MSTLSPDKVVEITSYVLFNEDELVDGGPPPDAVIVEAIATKYGFHPQRLEEKRDEVRELLNELPEQFHKQGGGGWSFLNACVDKNGDQWTGFHSIMDTLFALGMGLNMAEFQLPRTMWSALPGGMPYVMVDTQQDEDELPPAA